MAFTKPQSAPADKRRGGFYKPGPAATGGEGLVALPPFVLSVTSPSSNNKPIFSFHWATNPGIVAGDVIAVSAYTDSGLSALEQTVSYTLVSSDFTDLTFDFTGTPLAEGQKWFQGNISRGGSTSLSNVVQHSIDTSTFNNWAVISSVRVSGIQTNRAAVSAVSLSGVV